MDWILWAKPKLWQMCPTWGLFLGSQKQAFLASWLWAQIVYIFRHTYTVYRHTYDIDAYTCVSWDQLSRLTAEIPLKGLVSIPQCPLFQGFQVDEWVEIVEVSSVFQKLPQEDDVSDGFKHCRVKYVILANVNLRLVDLHSFLVRFVVLFWCTPNR